MKGKYIKVNDEYGEIGQNYKCPKCNYINAFSTNECCENCNFEQEYKDPDEWFNEQKTPYKQEYIEWRDKYFKQVDKVFEYQEYNNKTYHTKEMLYKHYEKAMKESPFK